MSDIYQIGIAIGLVVIYTILTIGVSFFICYILNGDDISIAFFISWCIGLLIFLFVSCLLLNELGMWNVLSK